MTHRRRAIWTITLAIILDVLSGIGFAHVEHISNGLGLYWAVLTATTVGYGDVVPHTALGHILAVIVMLTVIPLFAATYSLLTTAMTAEHVRKHIYATKKELKQHLEDRLERHLGGR